VTTLQFATCTRYRALDFIREVYPDAADTPASAGPLLDLVEQDIVRVQDPAMHGQVGIIPATNWDESYREAAIAAGAQLSAATQDAERTP